jgi:hypothetical protein
VNSTLIDSMFVGMLFLLGGCGAPTLREVPPREEPTVGTFREMYRGTRGESERRDLVIKAIDHRLIHEGMSLEDLKSFFGESLRVYRVVPDSIVIARAYVWFAADRAKAGPNDPLTDSARGRVEGWHISFDLEPLGVPRVWSYILSDAPVEELGIPWGEGARATSGPVGEAPRRGS